MKVISAEFVTSAGAGGATTGFPHDGLPQVVMAGRSNVGKSTLINALAKRPIARTSAAPGKTRLANIYRLTVEGHGPGRWSLYLVDLPGYGYARGGQSSAEELRAVAEAYFQGSGLGARASGLGVSVSEKRPRPERGAGGKSAEGGPPSESERGCRLRQGSGEPRRSEAEAGGPASREKSRPALRITHQSGTVLTLLLVDSRHPGLEADIQAYEWLASLDVEPLVVAAKVDKLSRAERTRNLREVERIFGKPALPVSAERGEGMDELWKTIANKAKAAERSLRAADE